MANTTTGRGAGKRSAATAVSPTPTSSSGITIPDIDAGQTQDDLPDGVYLETTPVPSDRAELFRMEGRIYTAPKHLPPNIVFKFMRELRRTGTDMATFWLIEVLISPSTVDLLADHDDLTDEELDQIMKVVRKHTMGALEKATGK